MNAQNGPGSKTTTRQKVLNTAFQLFHEQGYNATGVATILREAGINPGSLYHLFPGKDDLLLGVLEHALTLLQPVVMAPVEARTSDPIERVFALLAQYRMGMTATSCRMGCPIGNLALEVSDDSPKARKLIDRNFQNWIDHVESWLVAAGDRLPADLDRRELARFVLTTMEGGLMQARASGSVEPFDASIAQLRRYFDLLEQGPGRRKAAATSNRKTRAPLVHGARASEKRTARRPKRKDPRS